MLSPVALYYQQRCWIPCRQYTTSIMLHWHLSTLPYRTSFWSTACYFRIEQGSPLCLSGFFEPGYYQCQIFQRLCGILPCGDSWRSLSSQLFVVNSDISFLLFSVTLKFVEIFLCFCAILDVAGLLCGHLYMLQLWIIICFQLAVGVTQQTRRYTVPRIPVQSNLVGCTQVFEKLNKYNWFWLCSCDKIPQKTFFSTLLVHVRNLGSDQTMKTIFSSTNICTFSGVIAWRLIPIGLSQCKW